MSRISSFSPRSQLRTFFFVFSLSTSGKLTSFRPSRVLCLSSLPFFHCTSTFLPPFPLHAESLSLPAGTPKHS
jgi:hypothetical protein